MSEHAHKIEFSFESDTKHFSLTLDGKTVEGDTKSLICEVFNDFEGRKNAIVSLTVRDEGPGDSFMKILSWRWIVDSADAIEFTCREIKGTAAEKLLELVNPK